MLTLYGCLLLFLLLALSWLAYPFINQKQWLRFGITALFIVIFCTSLYQLSSDKWGLNEWLTSGKQHYQLLVQFEQLGGINGMITKVKARLKENPNDLEGQRVLKKLYWMRDHES